MLPRVTRNLGMSTWLSTMVRLATVENAAETFGVRATGSSRGSSAGGEGGVAGMLSLARAQSGFAATRFARLGHR